MRSPYTYGAIVLLLVPIRLFTIQLGDEKQKESPAAIFERRRTKPNDQKRSGHPSSLLFAATSASDSYRVLNSVVRGYCAD